MLLYALFLVLLGSPGSYGKSILKACENRVENESTLDNVFPRQFYVYLRDVKLAKISLWSKNGKKVYIRITIDCNQGIVKVAKMAKEKWTSFITPQEIECHEGITPVVARLQNKEVYIGEVRLQLKSEVESVEGNLEVKGDVTVESMAEGSGNCIDYPSTVTDCSSAYSWYSKHERCGKSGYFNCGHAPLCNGSKFAELQQLSASFFVCTKPQGEIVSDRMTSNDLNDVTAEEYCDILVNTS